MIRKNKGFELRPKRPKKEQKSTRFCTLERNRRDDIANCIKVFRALVRKKERIIGHLWISPAVDQSMYKGGFHNVRTRFHKAKRAISRRDE